MNSMKDGDSLLHVKVIILIKDISIVEVVVHQLSRLCRACEGEGRYVSCVESDIFVQALKDCLVCLFVCLMNYF